MSRDRKKSQNNKVNALSTRAKNKQEKILKVLSELVAESEGGTLIVVEGKKDWEALRCIGVVGPIFMVKGGRRSFLQAITELDQMSLTRVILLLDFDRRGRQGTICLKTGLERAKIKPDLSFWRALGALIGKDVQCIEGLTSYLQTLEAKVSRL